MLKRFYLDTSIWLDFFENRNEPNLPKGKWARALVNKIIKNNYKIVISEAVKNEMLVLGYSRYQIEGMLLPFSKILIEVYSTEKQRGKAKDLSKKRNIPLFDALHTLIARDSKAILITLDNHFQKLTDITKSHKPLEFI